MYLIFLIILSSISAIYCSSGDISAHYHYCVDKCGRNNCSADGDYYDPMRKQEFHLELLQWNCKDECKYHCMWRTTKAFLKRRWGTPKFHGKWPFVRFLGVQEPASSVFCLLNLIVTFVGFKQFQKQIRKDTPLIWMWRINYAIHMTTWICATIFHTRDFPRTEFMDYVSAFIMAVMTLYCAVQRIFYGMPRSVNVIVSTFILAFLINHLIYLNSGKVDYGYNIRLCLIIGVTTITIWFLWSFKNRKRQPYLWKLALYFSLLGLLSSLELYDFPPIYYVFDAHSLWHLGSAVIFPLYNRFILDDCKYLRKVSIETAKDKKES